MEFMFKIQRKLTNSKGKYSTLRIWYVQEIIKIKQERSIWYVQI